MNALLVSTKPATMQVWREELLALDPALDIRLFPDTGPVEDIAAAVTWNHPPEDLYRYPNLKLLISMGAGVDHLFRPPGPPPGVAVVRLVDRLLTTAMSEYVMLAVLRHHRQDEGYRALQAARVWEELPRPRHRGDAHRHPGTWQSRGRCGEEAGISRLPCCWLVTHAEADRQYRNGLRRGFAHAVSCAHRYPGLPPAADAGD